MARLLAQAGSPLVQASSPSAQGKAAAAQVGDRNWNWRNNLSCPTTFELVFSVSTEHKRPYFRSSPDISTQQNYH